VEARRICILDESDLRLARKKSSLYIAEHRVCRIATMTRATVQQPNTRPALEIYNIGRWMFDVLVFLESHRRDRNYRKSFHQKHANLSAIVLPGSTGISWYSLRSTRLTSRSLQGANGWFASSISSRER